MKTILGIDFGTTTTVIATTTPESRFGPELIEIDGLKRVDTVIRLDPSGEKVERIGEEAWEELFNYPERTFFDFKPHIGKQKHFAFGEKSISTFDLSVLFLRTVREKIEQQHFSQTALADMDVISIIGYPAEWAGDQKAAVVRAAMEAGFPNATGREEPLGAVYYHHYKGELSLDESQLLLVYDFGGGTTDVTVVRIGPERSLEILGFGGTNIGGHHIDDALTEIFSGELFGDSGGAPAAQDRARIRMASRKLKEKLSNARGYGPGLAEITIPLLRAKQPSCRLTLDIPTFERHCSECISRFEAPVSMALERAGVEMADIGTILLAGGAGRLYYAREKLLELFPQPQTNIQTSSPQEVVAMGLALFGRERLFQESSAGEPAVEEAAAEEEGEKGKEKAEDSKEDGKKGKGAVLKIVVPLLLVILLAGVVGIFFRDVIFPPPCNKKVSAVEEKFQAAKGMLNYNRVHPLLLELDSLEKECPQKKEEITDLKKRIDGELLIISNICSHRAEGLEEEYKEATFPFGLGSNKEMLERILKQANIMMEKKCSPVLRQRFLDIIRKCEKKLDLPSQTGHPESTKHGETQYEPEQTASINGRAAADGPGL